MTPNFTPTGRKIGSRHGLPNVYGFTLIEMMITISILVIMMALAAPSFISFRRNSELVGIANNFLAAVNAARSEAMKRNMFALVTPADGDSDWTKGWVVFVDTNDNNQFDSGDILIFRQEPMPSYISITGNGTSAASSSYIRYDGSGFAKATPPDVASTTLSFSRSDAASDYSQIRRIIVARTGRTRICKPQSATDTNCSPAPE